VRISISKPHLRAHGLVKVMPATAVDN
jgi:hypothetical protein